MNPNQHIETLADFFEMLDNEGYQYLGSGVDQSAYYDPKTDMVLKFVCCERASYHIEKVVKFFAENPCNYFPKVFSMGWVNVAGENHFCYFVEKLESDRDEVSNVAERLRDFMSNNGFYDKETTPDMIQSSYDKLAGDMVQYLDKFRFTRDAIKRYGINVNEFANIMLKTLIMGKSNGFSIDMHNGNWMIRTLKNGKKNLVLNDPFVCWK